jgi:hypothetical protein
MLAHHFADDLLVAEVAAHRLGLDPVRAQTLYGLFELVRAPRRDGQRMPLFAQHTGDPKPDTARSARHDRCAIGHVRSSSSAWDVARASITCA